MAEAMSGATKSWRASAMMVLTTCLLASCGGGEPSMPSRPLMVPAPAVAPPASIEPQPPTSPAAAGGSPVPEAAMSPPADPTGAGDTPLYGTMVRLGATRAEIESELGQPMGESVGPEGYTVQYMQGMPDIGAMMPSGGMMAAQSVVGTVAGFAGLLGPAGAIGGSIASQAMALGGQMSMATAGTPDFSKMVMIMVTYRDGRATHINVQRMGAMMGGG